MNKILTVLFFIFTIFNAMAQDSTLYFGHRGCRGILPENTIESFQKAIEIGVNGIEWDVVINANHELIISHEAYMDSRYCLNPDGSEIKQNQQKELNLYKMTTEQIQEFDCGSKKHKGFPNQKHSRCFKPTVQEAFNSLDFSETTILFEIKSEEKDYDIYQPTPAIYASIIAKEAENFKYKNNIIFMCFDSNLLNELYKLLPEYRYVYLTYLPFKDPTLFLKDIDFTPFAMGMYHRTIRKKYVKKLKSMSIKTFAWTVNESKIQDKLIRYGVDGIITDYPNIIR